MKTKPKHLSGTYEKSAHLGNCDGMNCVGMAYKDGEGVVKDLNKAREWFAKAVAQDPRPEIWT